MGDYAISIIIPVFQEGKQVRKNIRAIYDVIQANNIQECEFILIDDGSKDDTWYELIALSQNIPPVRAIRLSRNFGKESALCAGLEAATGNACIIMDSDLQHPPEIIPEMVRLWKDEGYEVVEAVKASRGKEGAIKKIGALLFYNIVHRLSGFNLKGASDFKLLDSKVVSAWKKMDEHNTFFRGMSAWVGFKRTSIPFTVARRTGGKSRWSLYKLARLAVNAITSFSSMPLQVVTFLGILFLTGSFVLGIQTLFMKFSRIAVSGFTTVILLLLIIGSVLMISLGIIGTYIARIYDEVKSRPRYIISDMFECRKVKRKDSEESL